MKKLISYILFTFFLCQISLAQANKEFNTDPNIFIKEFSGYLANAKRTDIIEFMKKFEKDWKKEVITPSEKSDIIEVINIMRVRKMNVPYIFNYLQTVDYAKVNTISFEQYTDWHNMLVRVLKTSKKGKHKFYSAFIKSTKALFHQNALYESKSRTWLIQTKEYSFTYTEDSIPIIKVPTTKLTGYTNNDSIKIYNTEGVYYPIEYKWDGDGGTMNWEKINYEKLDKDGNIIDKVFIDPKDVYCNLPEYEIDVTKAIVKIDSVMFYYKKIFNKPLVGNFEDKLKSNVKVEKNTYPRFISNEQELVIKNIFKNTDYIGGFSMEGPKIIGLGSIEKPAQLLLYHKDSLFIKTESKRYVIRLGDEIRSGKAKSTIYIRLDSSKLKDSIHHAGAILSLKVDSINTPSLTLSRGEHGIKKTAFKNSFHEYDMIVDKIIWKSGTDYIDFKMIGSGTEPAIYESFDFYKDHRFTQWKANLPYNPISSIKRFCEREDLRDSIPAIYIARACDPNLKVEHIRRNLYKLTEEGFLVYDEENEYVHVKEKTFKYVNAHAANYDRRFADRVDFDAIRLISNTGKEANSRLNLISNNMLMNGVRRVSLSDSQNVIVVPTPNIPITLKPRRDFEFEGRIFAGFLVLNGSGFFFNYENFTINMAKVDSFIIRLPNPAYDPRFRRGQMGYQPKLRPIETTINDMMAILRIDYPLNKSGLRKEEFPSYPELQSLDYSYAYYNKRKTQKGQYFKKDNVAGKEPFYYRLDTFLLDSINNLQPEGITFEGTLISAKIFPDFRETLRFREHDWSLGFIHQTPDTGYTAYRRYGPEGKGVYYDTIDLSNQGLLGKGMIEYIASESYSKDIVFLPDSCLAQTDSFVVHKGDYNGASFPAVTADSVITKWKPYKDTMYVMTRGEPFVMYDGAAEFRGKLMVTPWGLYGDGKMKIMESTMTSKSFKLNADDFNADNMDLEMRSRDPKLLALDAKGLSGKVDILNRTAEYNSLDKNAFHKMPYTEYLTNMDHIDWRMDKHEMQFATTKDVKKTWFRSTHKHQDSLDFNAGGAFFYLDSARNLLQATEVPYLPIADAQIFADSNQVFIYPHAKMDTLQNAVVKCDTETFYHQNIYASTINVRTKFKYGGAGNFDYINKTKSKQLIHFDKIRTELFADSVDWFVDDNKWETKATGTITEDQEFELNPKIGFKGRAHLYAIDTNLTFEGYSKVYQKHPMVQTDWFSFEDEIDPLDMTVLIDSPRNESGRYLYTGFFLKGNGIKQPYYRFLYKKINEGHHPIFLSDGVLQMDEKASEVTIGRKAKVKEGELEGQKLVFNDSLGIVNAEGKIDLGANLGMFEYETTGNMTHQIDNNTYEFDLLMLIDFHFPKEALEIMMDDVREKTHDMNPVFYGRPQFELALAEMAGIKEAKKIMKNYNNTEVIEKVPSKLEKTLFLTEVFMKYDSMDYCYKTYRPIGVGFIGKTPINKQTQAFMKIGFKRSGDYFDFYILAGDIFYYFTYKNSNKTLGVISSNNKFNRVITDVPSKKRRIKGEGREFFMFNTTSKRKAEAFLDEMLMDSDDDY